MSNVLQLLGMHGYSLYVWSAYGLVFFVLVLNLVRIKRQQLRVRHALRQWFSRPN